MLEYQLGTGEYAHFIIAETAFEKSKQGKCEAIFCQGNGYLGQRAALEEDYSGRKPDLLVNGTFDCFAENEVCELPNLPDVTNLTLTLDGCVFAMDTGKTENYLRTLNLKTGELTRSLEWTSSAGKRYRLKFTRFVSMDNEHILGTKVTVIPLDGTCTVLVSGGIDGKMTNEGTQHFLDGEKRLKDGKILCMFSDTVQSKVRVCLHTGFRFFVDGNEINAASLPVIRRRYMGMQQEISVSAGSTLTIEKLTSVTTSRDQACYGKEKAYALAEETGLSIAQEMMKTGYDVLFARSRQKWAELWEKQDIEIDSQNPFDQLEVRFALYHLNIMCAKKDERMGIGAKGLTGEGYKGHSFWDTEIFILPYFIFTQPEVARNLLTYRYLGLFGARKKARENGYQGAMYPWEAAWVDDGEVTPLWGGADIVTGKPIPILTGMIEQHITADVAYGVELYYSVTGDQRFMDDYGYEIILDTAKFWASRAEWNETTQRYEINDVIGPDEYKEHVNNNAYTNYMAAHNMRIALDAIETLEKAGGETAEKLEKQFSFASLRKDIQKVLDKLYLPVPNEEGIVPQFDGYFDLSEIDLTPFKTAKNVGTIYRNYNMEQISRLKVHKQADTLELMLLKDDLFPHDIKVKNYYYYEARTLHDSSLSKSSHCVLAADLQEDETAYRFFEGCGEIDLGSNMDTSDAGVHTASMGGIWQCAVYGFGGVRMIGNVLCISPRLPENWNTLRFTLMLHGQPLTVKAEKNAVLVTNHGKVSVSFRLRDKTISLPAGETIQG